MPYACKKPCTQPGCRVLVDRGYCSKHKRTPSRQHDANRLGSTARGYGYQWQKLSKVILAQNPVCQMTGCNRMAQCVDHIIPKPKGDDTLDNLQALCNVCHNQKTASEK